MATLKNRPRFSVSEPLSEPTAGQPGNPIVLSDASGARIELFVLSDDIIRVLVLPTGELRGPRTWSIAPGLEDVPLDGRDRRDTSGFGETVFSATSDAERLVVETAQVRLTVALDGGFCSWAIARDGAWHDVMHDRKTQAYNFGWWDDRVYHYVERQRGEMYVGLGERAGTLDRANQSYEMRNIDAMGYSARSTDPLYKHIPFYVTWQP
ncbi:MAG: alpha-glucosidase, partial [Paraburkholderia hospita]